MRARPILSGSLLLLASLAVPAALRAQTVAGRVTDERGAPLPGATVTLVRPDAAPLRLGTVTDRDGRYRLRAPGPGAYGLRVTFVGYAAAARDVAVPAGEAVVDVALDPAALAGAEVVVEGTARVEAGVAPVTASALTAAELETLPDAKDLPAALAAEPSVTFYSENGNALGYSYLRLRGFDERRVAVSLNGQPMNDPEDQAVYWINVQDLQGAITDVQVQRGAGGSFYGSTAVGGAINVVADPYRADPYVTLDGGYGGFRTSRMTVEANSGLVGGRYVAFARASHLRSDGYRCHSRVEMTRLFGGVTRYGNTSRLTIQAFGGPQRDALAYYGIAKSANARDTGDCADDTQRRYNYGAISGDVERLNQPFAEVRHEWSLGRGVRLEQGAYYTHSAGYFDFASGFRSADYLRLPASAPLVVPADCYGAPVDPATDPRTLPLDCAAPSVSGLVFRANVVNDRAGYLPRLVVERGRNRYTVGADLLVHRSLHEGRIQEAAGLSADLVGEGSARAYAYRGGKEHAAIYGSALVRPDGRLAVQADVQVRRLVYRLYDEAYVGTRFAVPYTFVNPRLGATLFPERPVRFYGSVAYAAREPRLTNFHDAAEAGAGALPLFAPAAGGYDYDRPLVRPEKGVNVEAGGAWETRRGRLAVTGYGLWLRDEIVPSGGVDVFGVPRTGNAARTRHVGVEVEGAVRLPYGLAAEASATASDDRFVRFTEFTTGDDGATVEVDRGGHRIALFPAASARAALRFETAGWGGRLGLLAVGVQPTTNDGTADRTTVVDPYALADLSVWATRPVPGGEVRLALDVNNLADARVLTAGNSSGFFPAATRHAFLGLRYTLR